MWSKFANVTPALEILQYSQESTCAKVTFLTIDNIWENRHSSDFQLQWKLDFRINGLNFEKMVDLVRQGLGKHDTLLRKTIPAEKRQNSS